MVGKLLTWAGVFQSSIGSHAWLARAVKGDLTYHTLDDHFGQNTMHEFITYST